jgi:hypothetical protein
LETVDTILGLEVCPRPGTASPDAFLEVKVCPAVGLEPRSSRLNSGTMTVSGNEFLRLESLIFRPVSTRPDWLKAWRNEANYLLFLARRAEDADDIEMLEELEEQAREMADMVEARWQAERL